MKRITAGVYRRYRASRPSGPKLAALIVVLLVLPVAHAQMAISLTVRIEVAQASAGSVQIAVFDSKRTFDERIDPVAQARVAVERSDTIEWSVELPSPGSYAVIAYQDLNENGQIDMTRLGRPTEPYGFSNNARAPFGPPGFGKAKIDLDARPFVVEIELR